MSLLRLDSDERQAVLQALLDLIAGRAGDHAKGD